MIHLVRAGFYIIPFRPYTLCGPPVPIHMTAAYIDVAYNTCFGGFGLSEEAKAMYVAQCPGVRLCDYAACVCGGPGTERIHQPVLLPILTRRGQAHGSS